MEEALVEVEFEAEYKDYKKFREAVSIQLQNLKREKKIAQYHADETGKNVFYGLFEWLDDNGRPKTENMYDPFYLTSNHPDHPRFHR